MKTLNSKSLKLSKFVALKFKSPSLKLKVWNSMSKVKKLSSIKRRYHYTGTKWISKKILRQNEWGKWYSKDVIFPKGKQTIRNSFLKLPIISTFKKLVSYADLPLNFQLKPFKVLRYRALFYGYNYQTNFFNYNLWLTMGLKRNISMSFSLFYNSPRPRKIHLASFNRYSWKYYAYLLKNSLQKNIISNDFLTEHKSFYFSSNLFYNLSDVCIWNLRPQFKFHRTISLGSDDLDFSISTYHYRFDYYNFRSRAQYFWISNNSYFRDTTCYITSYDPSMILSPRKYLKFLWLLKKFAKYHRSWYFLGEPRSNIFNLYYKNMFSIYQNFFLDYFKININFKTKFKLTIFKLFLKMFLNKKNSTFTSVSINKGSIIDSFNLIKFFFMFNGSTPKIYQLYQKFYNFIDKPCLDTYTKLKINSKPKNPKNLLRNLHSIFKCNVYSKKLFSKRWHFKFNNYYFRSHGFLKFRLKRWREKSKGFITYRAIGICHSLRIKKTAHQPLRRFSAFFHFYRKRTAGRTTFLNLFSRNWFNLYFLTMQHKWNINLNFFNSNMIESFNFQLYFFISYLLRIQQTLTVFNVAQKKIVIQKPIFFKENKMKYLKSPFITWNKITKKHINNLFDVSDVVRKDNVKPKTELKLMFMKKPDEEKKQKTAREEFLDRVRTKRGYLKAVIKSIMQKQKAYPGQYFLNKNNCWFRNSKIKKLNRKTLNSSLLNCKNKFIKECRTLGFTFKESYRLFKFYLDKGWRSRLINLLRRKGGIYKPFKCIVNSNAYFLSKQYIG